MIAYVDVSGLRIMENTPFLTRDRNTLVPNEVAKGAWDPKSLHGPVVIGLLDFVIE
ncbi:hypothetical protein [Bradyrhizobium hereditatis]|uniref:hypothetical protein n=1 Tax=Bradyrhizobium hereditatis TaxID=2821405 RepID=UPI00289D8962|nr:hypothetical protein [Bradyrhizobium hereditatis]